MEVKPGYKQTEEGVIPKEWEVKRLGEIATIATGNTPPTNDATNYGDEFLFAGPVDIGDAKFVTRTEKKLSKKGFEMSRRFPKNSILFVSIGSTIGKCGIASVELTSNQQINAVFPSPSFSVDYLFYAVCTAAPKIKAQAGEQAVPIVNKTQFSETAVAIPPLPEQRAIAGALSDVDALLSALDQLIAKKRDLKQAAMQQLLTGQTRLPGFHGEWEMKRLGEIITLIPGGIYGEEKPRDGLKPCRVATTAHIDEDDSWNSNEMNVRYFSSEEVERYSPREGDLIVVKSSGSAASIQSGKIGFVDRKIVGQFLFSNFLMLLRPTAITARFLFFYLTSYNVKKLLPSLVEASTYPNIRRGEYLALEIPIPPHPEQTAIAEVLTDMDAELAASEQRRAKTRALKQGMMQELLTGRTRLV